MSTSKYKSYTRRFIEKQLTHFRNALAAFPKSAADPPGVDRWGEGNRQYYMHAIATCAFMFKQLEHYREPPYYPPDKRKKGV